MVHQCGWSPCQRSPHRSKTSLHIILGGGTFGRHSHQNRRMVEPPGCERPRPTPEEPKRRFLAADKGCSQDNPTRRSSVWIDERTTATWGRRGLPEGMSQAANREEEPNAEGLRYIVVPRIWVYYQENDRKRGRLDAKSLVAPGKCIGYSFSSSDSFL